MKMRTEMVNAHTHTLWAWIVHNYGDFSKCGTTELLNTIGKLKYNIPFLSWEFVWEHWANLCRDIFAWSFISVARCHEFIRLIHSFVSWPIHPQTRQLPRSTAPACLVHWWAGLARDDQSSPSFSCHHGAALLPTFLEGRSLSRDQPNLRRFISYKVPFCDVVWLSHQSIFKALFPQPLSLSLSIKRFLCPALSFSISRTF